MKERISFVDIAKAFAIFFIVFGHTLVHSEHLGLVFKLLYSFHVVLFFILSGYTFRIKKDENFGIFLKNKIVRIIVPYAIWALLFLIPYMLLGRNVGSLIGTHSSFDIKVQLYNILYGNGNLSALKQNSSLWFLPALFTMEIFYYFILKYVGKGKRSKFGLLIALMLVGIVSNNYLSFYLPWGINTCLNLGIFFYIGYSLREFNLFTDKGVFKIYYMIPCLVVGLLSAFYNQDVSCIDYEYGNYLLFILSSLGLSIFVIYISYIINKSKILEYIGKNTMGILIFHKLIILVFQTKLGVVSKLLLNSNFVIELLLSIVISLISIAISLLATEITRRILPFLIGEKFSLKKKRRGIL